MDFLHKNKNGEIIKLPVRVMKSAAHQDVYANGALGGALANYHFRIDFYRDEFPPKEFTVDGQQIRDESIVEIRRTIESSVYLSIPFLKELSAWLDKQVAAIEQQYGEIALPKNDEGLASSEEKAIPEVKEA